MAAFQNGLLGCFGDFKLCLLTFCCPAYTVGKNAEYLGESCLIMGALFCVGFTAIAPINRWRLRERLGIEGSLLEDVIFSTVLPCCSIIQEAREIEAKGGANVVGSMKKDLQIKEGTEQAQEMTRT
ncbi:unnamed protein product [Owenia fusiformis]|uniref:Uncharacterized protein n=1 Tax=Owenia fusiformis TaxID=6347 RepID=A0A8S4PFY2_OWEFU|nr:unnamed protein product [Owenia fusiformis]